MEPEIEPRAGPPGPNIARDDILLWVILGIIGILIFVSFLAIARRRWRLIQRERMAIESGILP